MLFVDTDSLQRLMGRGWPGLERQTLGEWELRAGAGFTGRANSCLPAGDPGMSWDRAIDAVSAFYLQRGITPKFQVSFAADALLPAPGLDAQLAALGWVADPVTLVMTAEPDNLPAEVDLGLRYHWSAEPDDTWLGFYHYRGGDLPDAALRVITAAPAWYLTASSGNEPVGIGRLALTDDWAGLAAIEVAQPFRRRGFGSALTGALAARGIVQGAEYLYLQVFAHNPAVALYRKHGFRVHHAYHYRVPPGRRHRLRP